MALVNAEPELLKKGIAIVTGVCAAIMLTGILYRSAPPRWVTGAAGGVGLFVGFVCDRRIHLTRRTAERVAGHPIAHDPGKVPG